MAAVLVAAGFDESVTIECLSQMREAGIKVSLVGLSAGLITSRHGVAMRCDLGIDQWPPAVAPQLLLIPGDRQCATAIAADPRAYRLIENTIAHDGIVAVARGAQETLASSGIPAHSFLGQEADSAEFASQLTRRLLG